jgi:hypothetical protein
MEHAFINKLLLTNHKAYEIWENRERDGIWNRLMSNLWVEEEEEN